MKTAHLRMLILMLTLTSSGCAINDPGTREFFKAIGDALNHAADEMNKNTERQRKSLNEQNSRQVEPLRTLHCTTTIDNSFGLNTATTTCF